MKSKFNLLKVIKENSNMTQRDISNQIEISLGKVNSILKECIEERYISVEKESGTSKYIIEEKGEQYLETTIKELKSTKLLLNRNINKKVNEAVILAAGKREDFETPIGLIELEEEKIIERTIKLLKEEGITKIYVVAGYKFEEFQEYFENDEVVEVVLNDRYKWTGTMSSLSKVNGYVSDDFLLIESDLVFEREAIRAMMNSNCRDCILITNESGSGDEAFVQLEGDYLYKMSKDIHQFNRIDGEMIGISRISINLFNMMVDLFKKNINEYLNYEYLILDVARDYSIKCIRVDDLSWGEVDTDGQLTLMRNHIFPKIKRKDKEKEEKNIKLLIQEYLDISLEEISEITSAGGMTNKNYKVKIRDEYYILRIPGAGTEDMISRRNEMINSKCATEQGFNVELLIFDEERGVKLAKFIEDAETLNGRTSKKEENLKKVSKILYDLHNSDMSMENKFDVFEEIEKYENLVVMQGGNFYKDYDKIKSDVMELKWLLSERGLRVTPSHNDTVPENFIKDKNGQVYLIDWEYSGLNDEMWDVAGFFTECEFNSKDEELFLNYYFEGGVGNNEKIKIVIHKICQDFLWAIWTLIKEGKGDDFGTYGVDRYNRAVKNISKLKKLISNE